MESPIIVAIISAVVAVVTLIVSSVANLAANKRAINAEKELEQFKRQLDLRREGIENRTKNIRDINEVLGKTCTHLQNIRDQVRRLKLAEETSEKHSICEKLKDEFNAFEKLYSESHYILPEFERRIFHDTRNYADEVVHRCIRCVKSEKPLPSDVEEWLRPIQNSQRLLIAEYEKWNNYLVNDWRDIIFQQQQEKFFQIDSNKKTGNVK